MNDFFNARDVLRVGEREYVIYRLDALEKAGLTNLKLLPFSIRVVLEAALRQCNDKEITQTDVKNIAAWTPKSLRPGIPFLPARVVMQDFTGVPAVVDLAAMRSAVARLGGEGARCAPRCHLGRGPSPRARRSEARSSGHAPRDHRSAPGRRPANGQRHGRPLDRVQRRGLRLAGSRARAGGRWGTLSNALGHRVHSARL